MQTLRLHSAVVLLAVFTLGGVVLPAMHEVEHALERQEQLGSHESTDHHHHTDGEDHGTEIQPPCAQKLDSELTCVLCHGVSGFVSEQVAVTGTLLEGRQLWEIIAADAPRGNNEHVLVRGPPAQIV